MSSFVEVPASPFRFASTAPAPRRVAPGQVWVGGRDEGLVQTLLGSCVSLVLWHPEQRVGGMCHYMLLGQQGRQGRLDGRYAEDALELLLGGLRQRSAAPWGSFEAHLFGGADAFGLGPAAALAIGHHNVRWAQDKVRELGLSVHTTDVLERFPRLVELDTTTGLVRCRRSASL